MTIKMKFYWLEAKADQYQYDTVDAFVVEAGSPAEAREVAAENCGDEGKGYWLSARRSTCRELKQTGEACLVVRSFNAG